MCMYYVCMNVCTYMCMYLCMYAIHSYIRLHTFRKSLSYTHTHILSANIHNIFTYKKNELFRPDTAIYQRSHFTKKLEISLDNIEISNEPLFNLYKSNKIYYWAFESEYFNTNTDINKLQIQLRKGTFVLRQSVPFSCMAELLYNVIDFYNRIKDFLYANLCELRCIEDEGGVLSQRQRKNKYIMENALHYHINNRFIIRFDYDIDTKSAYPILLPY
jgi:hypothetical protein